MKQKTRENIDMYAMLFFGVVIGFIMGILYKEGYPWPMVLFAGLVWYMVIGAVCLITILGYYLVEALLPEEWQIIRNSMKRGIAKREAI